MFNNIIYFLIIIVVYNFSFSSNTQGDPLWLNLLLAFFTWSLFAFYCRLGCRRLLVHCGNSQWPQEAAATAYHNLIFKLSVLAILLFVVDVYLFHLKHWLHHLPPMRHLAILENLAAITLFIFYLSTIWFFVYPAYQRFFSTSITRRSFIRSNIRLNFPILFPFLALTLLNDLIVLGPWSGPERWLNNYQGQMIFFTVFILILMVFMPLLIKQWWGCSLFSPSDKLRELQVFLKEKAFKYRELLNWPIFEGRMITAGIMGIIPRYRYILLTDSLMKTLSVDELKAVLAHEMGHARYRHLLFYVVFFIGYMFISFGLIEVFYLFLLTRPDLTGLFGRQGAEPSELLYLLLGLPILVMMLIYFRYVMGFFMRHFERQADLYSAVVMNSPIPTISSLEKIAVFGGKTRELPSWHHFSIKQRVDCLWRTLKDKDLVKRHNRFVRRSFTIYLVIVFGLGVILHFSPVKGHIEYRLMKNTLQQMIDDNLNNLDYLVQLVRYLHSLEKLEEAKEIYERIITVDPDHAEALNNLAWILVTDPHRDSRDPARAIALAEKAVALEKSSIHLDTLAEAYYIAGDQQKALEVIQDAIALATENKSYYRQQLKRFRAME